jgi:hypothetical protein
LQGEFDFFFPLLEESELVLEAVHLLLVLVLHLGAVGVCVGEQRKETEQKDRTKQTK